MGDDKKLTDYLETILNLQCENQEVLNGLLLENKQLLEQLLQKAQEINARAKNLQMEVMDVQDALCPPVPLEEEEPARETPPAPARSHLLRYIGTAGLLCPIIWNGLSAGVYAVWRPDASSALVMTACISAAWGLLLIAVEPPLNRALHTRAERRRAEKQLEDEELEELLGKDRKHQK